MIVNHSFLSFVNVFQHLIFFFDLLFSFGFPLNKQDFSILFVQKQIHSQRVDYFIDSSQDYFTLFSPILLSSLSMSSLATGDIVGIAIGGVLAVVTVIGIVISLYAMCCKKEPKNPQTWPQQQDQYPPHQNPYGQPMNTSYYGQQQQQPYSYHPGQGWNNPQYTGDLPPAYNAANLGSSYPTKR